MSIKKEHRKEDELLSCPNCGSNNKRYKGYRRWKNYKTGDKVLSEIRRYMCNDCKKYFTSETGKKSIDNIDGLSLSDLNFEKIENGNELLITAEASGLDELIKKCNIDTNIWYCYDFEIVDGQWDVASKYRDQDLKWKLDESGKQVMEGYAIRKPEWLKGKNYKKSIKAKFKRKVDILDITKFREDLIEEFKQKSKFKPALSYVINRNEDERYYLLINNFDFHFGKYIYSLYNTEIAAKLFIESVKYHLDKFKGKNIVSIIFPLGNDIFNSDYSYGDEGFPRTTKGTPQQEDMYWQEIFTIARKTCITTIDMMKKVAMVTGLRVPGNHDFSKSFYLTDALHCYYYNDMNVNIYNNRSPHIYHKIGNTLLGFTHGMPKSNIRDLRLLTKMQQDKPKEWSETEYHEWFLGHIHHEKEVAVTTVEDVQGIVVRYMRTPMPICDWEEQEQYLSKKGTAAYLYEEMNGLTDISRFNIEFNYSKREFI